MKATLVQTNGTVRFYKLSEPVLIGKSDLGGVVNIIDSVTKWDLSRMKEEARKKIEPYFSDPAGIYYVAISDATTHYERLIFPAYPAPNEGTYGFTMGDIGGRHTMMSEGGSIRLCYSDGVLLRWLARINGLNYEGIEKPLPEGLKRELASANKHSTK